MTELPIVTEVKPLQFRKALSPMEMTELGITTEVKPLQPSKAASPMEVTELEIMVFRHPAISVFVAVSIMALQLFRLSYAVFPDSTTMEVKPLQLLKALSPMEVTELGIVTEVKPRHPSKAHLPMEVTELPIVTEVKLL